MESFTVFYILKFVPPQIKIDTKSIPLISTHETNNAHNLNIKYLKISKC